MIPRERRHRSTGLPACLAASLLALVPAARTVAGPPQPGQQAAGEPGWIARFDFSLEVDGVPSPDARFFQERNGRRVLIQYPGSTKAALVSQAGKEVRAIDVAKLAVLSDGDAARLAPEAESGTPVTTYTVNDQIGEVVFYLGRQRLKIIPKQPLVGPVTPEDVLRHTPVYRKGMDVYTPDPGEVAFLRSIKERLDIEVYFGTWCPHCKVLVPKFMRTVLAASNPNIRVAYTGVPQPFTHYEPARSKGIMGIPTFIFYRSGNELGRIPGEPPPGSTIEKAMADIVRHGGS